jgi:diguanylate cyclase (GGDEF)-like protein/PAS domain S-box-containing protein
MITASPAKAEQGLPAQSLSQEPISTRPTASFADEDSPLARKMLIGSGALLALSLALLIHTIRRARRHPVGGQGKPEREQPFRSFVEHATDPIFRYDRDCRRIYVNPAASRLASKPMEDLIGNTPADQALLDSEQCLCLMQAIGDVFANGESRQLQVHMVTAEGERRDYHVLLIPEHTDTGEVESVLSMSSDRTEIRRTETRHAQYFDVAPGLFYTLIHKVDGSYCMTFANAGVYNLYGLEPEEVKKDFSTLLALVHPDDVEMRRRKLKESERDLTPFLVDYRVLNPIKGLLWLEVHALPQRQADGSTRWDGFVHDITERKRMESELQLKEYVLDHARIGVYLIDENVRITYVNDEACHALGYSREELLTKTTMDINADHSIGASMAVHQKLLEDGAYTFETKHVRSDGSLLPVEIRASALEYQGKNMGLALAADITERKRMEEALNKERAILKTFFGALPDLAWMKDTEGRFLACNPLFETLFGATEAEILGKTDFDFFDAEAAEFFRRKDKEAETAGKPCINEEWVTFAVGGRRALIETVKSPVVDADGKVIGVIGVAHEITERKRIEDLLAAREQEFRALAENSPDIIMRYDRQCRRIYVNPAFVKQVGKPAEELLGGTPTEYSRLPQAVLYQEALQRAIESGSEVEHEYTWPTVSGRIVVSDFRIAPERDANGQIASVLAIGRDITERKAMEDALHDNLRFTRELIEAIPGPVFFKDADGLYLGCNAAFERYYGMRRDDLIGKGVFDLWPRDLAERYHAADRQLIENPGSQIYEAQMQAPEGRRDVVFHKATFARADGSTGGQIGVILDITERKQAEQYEKFRTRSLELLSSSASLSTILEGIVLGIEQLCPGALCSILLLDSEGKHLVDGIAPSLPDFYNTAIDGTKIGLGIGSCGEAAFTGRRVIVEDLETHPNWTKARKLVNRAELGACWSEPIRSASGAVLGTFAIYHREPYSPTESDLSLIEKTAHLASIAIERKRAEVELRRRELEFRSLVENTPDIISRYDRECRRLFANAAFYAHLKTSTTALGKRPSEFPGGETGVIVEAKVNEVFATGQNIEFELQWTDLHDNECCTHFRLTAERDASGAIISVLSIGHDITELNQSRQKIHQMAFYDTLTKLPNRALFNDRLHQMLIEAARHGQQAGVMLLDLDRFKVVNDTLGHPAGDQLLREAGARLSSCLRDYDTVARLGGDEFAILLPEIRSGNDMGKIASNILDVFKAPFMLEGQEAFISTSIGIAAYPGDSLDADELIKQADSAMYSAKRSGRNAFCFYSKDLTDSANERLTLETDLRHGFERGELELYYQPKVCLATGMVLGSEALLRWHHPARGMVAPDKFIPIAEDSGQIIEIGAWVLREACLTANEWNAPGKPLHKVAINLSARQFQVGHLLQTVRNALDETNCRTDWIELEITESMLLDEDGKVLEILETLRAMGITIAIDDFGTGYSSLSYLARFPIDTLKIDRSFTSRVVQSEDHAELVKAMISIAQNLKQNVVAEGVETEEEAAFLREHGCHVGQGYLYSKPVPKTAFESHFFTDKQDEIAN